MPDQYCFGNTQLTPHKYEIEPLSGSRRSKWILAVKGPRATWIAGMQQSPCIQKA